MRSTFLLPAKRVIRSLNRIIILEWRGKPGTIWVDNCPEYISENLMKWAEKHGVTIPHIQPGQPQQNACIERYNRTVRHEWLDQYIIESIEEAQDHATQWLWTYNNDRPNMGIGGITPAQKLKMAAQVLRMHPVKNGGITMGQELHAEEMIKMPLNLDPRQGTDWRATMNAALGKLKELDLAAEKYRGETGRYIRPIMLVQVERTGKDQRDGAHIHANDVRDWLLQSGFDGAEVAVKTAEQNDLSQPENLDLLSPTNRVRVIITKAALQEGWDCPFA